MKMKRCPDCKKSQSIYGFGVAKDTHDGLQSICRQCKSRRAKIYREANKRKWEKRDPHNEAE